MTTAVSVYIVESFVYRWGMVVSNIIGFSSVHLERHLLTFPGTVASNSPPIAPRQVIRNTESGKSFIAKFAILAFGIRSKAQGIRNPSSIEKNQESSSWNPESTAWNLESKNVLDYLTSCLRNQRSFGDDINGFPAKRRLRNERRNSIVMTRHYPDLGGASDWLNQNYYATRPIRSTTQIWAVTRHQYGISALASQTSFGGETSGSVAKCRLLS